MDTIEFTTDGLFSYEKSKIEECRLQIMIMIEDQVETEDVETKDVETKAMKTKDVETKDMGDQRHGDQRHGDQ